MTLRRKIGLAVALVFILAGLLSAYWGHEPGPPFVATIACYEGDAPVIQITNHSELNLVYVVASINPATNRLTPLIVTNGLIHPREMREATLAGSDGSSVTVTCVQVPSKLYMRYWRLVRSIGSTPEPKTWDVSIDLPPRATQRIHE